MADVCSFYSALRQTDFQSTTAPKEFLSPSSRVWICRLQNMNKLNVSSMPRNSLSSSRLYKVLHGKGFVVIRLKTDLNNLNKKFKIKGTQTFLILLIYAKLVYSILKQVSKKHINTCNLAQYLQHIVLKLYLTTFITHMINVA